MSKEKEMTTLSTSVGSDDGQSLNVSVDSIPENSSEFNNLEEDFKKMQQEMLRQMDPSYLKTVTMTELYDTVYPGRQPLIDGLLYLGTYLFVGAPQEFYDGTTCLSHQHWDTAVELYCAKRSGTLSRT
jgi:hypothetical protein